MEAEGRLRQEGQRQPARHDERRRLPRHAATPTARPRRLQPPRLGQRQAADRREVGRRRQHLDAVRHGHRGLVDALRVEQLQVRLRRAGHARAHTPRLQEQHHLRRRRHGDAEHRHHPARRRAPGLHLRHPGHVGAHAPLPLPAGHRLHSPRRRRPVGRRLA